MKPDTHTGNRAFRDVPDERPSAKADFNQVATLADQVTAPVLSAAARAWLSADLALRGEDDLVHGEAGEAVLVVVHDVLVDVVEDSDGVAELAGDLLGV